MNLKAVLGVRNLIDVFFIPGHIDPNKPQWFIKIYQSYLNILAFYDIKKRRNHSILWYFGNFFVLDNSFITFLL